MAWQTGIHVWDVPLFQCSSDSKHLLLLRLVWLYISVAETFGTLCYAPSGTLALNTSDIHTQDVHIPSLRPYWHAAQDIQYFDTTHHEAVARCEAPESTDENSDEPGPTGAHGVRCRDLSLIHI